MKLSAGSALIDTGDGRKVPLEEVAEIVSVGGPNTITRENVQRKLVVSANVSGRDVKSVVDDIRANIEQNITLPEGYRIEYGGQFESAQNAQRRDRLRKNSLFPLCYGCIIATNGVPKDEHTISYCFATILICVEPAEGVEDTHIGLAEVTREVEVVV